MRRHFLIDTSALVPFFLKATAPDIRARAAIARLLALRAEQRAWLHLPNFCMAECSKAFSEVAFGSTSDYRRALDQYNQNVEKLLDYVSSRRQGIIRSMPMERRHLVDIEDVFKAEYSLPARREGKRLSGLDALVIAMGKDLAKTHGRDHVMIVTKDEQMARVCNQNRSMFPKAIYILEDPIPV